MTLIIKVVCFFCLIATSFTLPAEAGKSGHGDGCGNWALSQTLQQGDERLKLTLNTPSGDRCPGSFTLKNNTSMVFAPGDLQVYSIAGYTLELEINRINSDVRPQTIIQDLNYNGKLFIIPSFDVNIIFTPQDIYKPASVYFQARQSLDTLVVDLHFGLIETALKTLKIPCTVSARDSFAALARGASLLRGVAERIEKRDFNGARIRLEQVAEDYYNRIQEYFLQIGIDCVISEIIESKISLLPQVLISVILWEAKIIADYITYQGRSVVYGINYDPIVNVDVNRNLIAYVGLDSNIWTVRSDGSEMRQITYDATGPFIQHVDGSGFPKTLYYYAKQWSPDGRYLAFIRYESDYSEADGEKRSLIVFDTVTRNIQEYSMPVFSFSWRPDNSGIAFSGYIDGVDGIYWLSLIDNSSQPTLLIPAAKDLQIGGPSWSPNGRYLAFGEFRHGIGEGTGEFAFYDFQEKKYHSWNAVAGHYSWMPDSERIVFDNTVYMPGNGSGLWVANIHFNNRLQVFLTKDQDINPFLSPVNDDVAFVRTSEDWSSGPWGGEIWLTNLTRGGLRRLTDFAADIGGWSADGKYLLVSGQGSGMNEGVLIIEVASGKIIRKIADGGGAIWQPAPRNQPLANVTLAVPPDTVPARRVPTSRIRVSANAFAPPSINACNEQTTFEPSNVLDGRFDTAWRVPGNGIGSFIQLDFDMPVQIDQLYIVPGYAKTDPCDGIDRFLQNRRVRQVMLTFENGEPVSANLEDRPIGQAINFPIVTTRWVRVTITSTTDFNKTDGRDFTPISEIGVDARYP